MAAAAVLVTGLAFLLLRPVLEEQVRARIESTAMRHGMVARIRTVRVGLWPWLRLEGIDLDLGHGARLHAEAIRATWPGRLRLGARAVTLSGPAGVTISMPVSTWDVSGLFREDLQLALVLPQRGLTLRRHADPVGSEWTLETQGLDLNRLLDIQRDGQPLLEGGVVAGHVNLRLRREALHVLVDLDSRGVRLGALSGNAEDDPPLGEPTDVALRLEGDWRRQRGAIELPEIRGTVAGANVSGSLSLQHLDADPVVDFSLGVQRLDFARLLATSGLELPEDLKPAAAAGDLGTVTIGLQVKGRLSEPAALAVSQKIEYKPPRTMPRAIARLRSDFVYTVEDGRGPPRRIDVSPDSPDFIAISAVPPLFVRTLLLAEDASFYGHRGIDLRELPAALLTNWSRGTAARGASTITQQLAKNLFLSREKRIGRKLQELAITFLLESALGKQRILEIYLNIIEWGPGLRGLRAAARAYFGKEPAALTPAEMAFLVAIIPGPIKYQSSFARGAPGPGLRALIDDLLAKLRSVDAISVADYQRALDDPLVIAGRRP